MYYIKDEYSFQEGMEFQLMHQDGMQGCMHCHDGLEIDYVDKGCGVYVIEDRTYDVQPGDFFVINNSEKHMMIADDSNMVVSVCIFEPRFIWDQMDQDEYLKPFFSRKVMFANRIRKRDSFYNEMKRNMESIFSEYAMQEKGWNLSIKSNIIQIVINLYRHCHEQNEMMEDVGDFQTDYHKIRPVIDYIHRNFRANITLEDVAKEVALSKNYLCTRFKTTLGCTVFEYIERVRIDYATLLLETTSLSVSEIASKAGFNGISYFNRVFKKSKGVAPSQYRKQIRNPFA
ncbi:MAG: AraC family transcriptional regulator [Lachnospiraceae bacterium]|jgi:AraC-like DNA-binding protein